MSKQVHILWEGTQLAHHSLALVNRHHCLGLLASGAVELTLIPHEPDQFAPEPNSDLERLMGCDVRRKGLNLRDRKVRPHVWVKHTWPPRSKPPGNDRWVVMLPWEYSLLPTCHVNTLRGATEIWTPSRFSARAFMDSGVESPVHVVPNGVDTELFSAEGKRYDSGQRGVRFLFVGGTIYRKGIDILLEAYTRAFSRHDSVSLTIKDFGNRTLYRGQTAEALIRERGAGPDAPEIAYIDSDMDQRTLADLYSRSDVLVCPYRGEGFSLPTLEAMACGTPVIVTAGGATDDFVDAASGWRLPSHRIPVGTSVYGDELPAEGYLLEPDVAELARVLRGVYENPTEIARKGREAAATASAWTWKQATLRLLERIDYMCGTDTVRVAMATAGAQASSS